MIALRSLALVLGTAIMAGCGRDSGKSVTAENPTNSAMVQNEPRLLPPTSRENAGSRTYAETNPAGPAISHSAPKGTNAAVDEVYPDEADRAITRRIRTAIQENDQFSDTAKKIEIVTFNRRVVLHGAVISQQEKDAIASLVDQAGVTLLDNNLQVDAQPATNSVSGPPEKPN